jgi:hypothetical protein
MNRFTSFISKIFCATFVVMVCAEVSIAGEYENFRKERVWLIKEMQEIFIRHNICSSEKDCNAMELNYYSPIKTGVFISINSVTDKDVLQEIAGKAIELFYSRNDMDVIIEGYLVSKRKSKSRFFSSPKPFFVVQLKRS